MKTLIIALSFLVLSQSSFAQKEASIIESNNKFSFDIYQKLKNKSENIIFSPASITSALAMTYVGAKNNTLNEISKTFYFDIDINAFSKDYKYLFMIDQIGNSELNFYNANSLWIQNELSLNKDFLNINKQYFSSSLHFTDFVNETEPSKLKINQWVEDNTNKKIKNLLGANTIDKSTRLVLVNALYFKGAWQNKFDKKNNTIDNFQVGKNKFIKTTYMNRYINSWYYEDKYAQIIDIPYSDEDISLMIVFPKSFKKIKKFEKKLNYEYYINYAQNKKIKRIDLSLPKFSIESDYNLNRILHEMGIKDAFTSKADFSGITEQERLFISSVIHKANIVIDEEGTEATAATAVVMRKSLFLGDEVKVNINKPFIYILRNNINNCIYFMGKINNPN